MSSSTGPSIVFLIPDSVVFKFSNIWEMYVASAFIIGFAIMAVHVSSNFVFTLVQIPFHHSGIPWKKLTVLFHASGIVSVKNLTIPFQAAKKPFLTASQTEFTASRNHSHLLYNTTNAATIAVITAITGCAIISPNSPFTSPFIFVIIFMIVPPTPDIFDIAPVMAEIPVDIFPITMSSGPIAATRIPIITIACCTPSGSAENLFTRFVIISANFWIIGASVSPICIPAVSSDPFNSSIALDPSPI